MRVLLIEDNPDDAVLIRRTLTKGTDLFDLVHAPNLSEGLELIKHDHVEVILLDMNLPDSTGIDTLRTIRNHGIKLPIVILTGLQPDDKFLIETAKEGADDFFNKQEVTPNLIRRSIRYAIERRSLWENKLRDAQRFIKLKDEFIGMISHELRSPLSTISLSMENLEAGIAGPVTPKQAKILKETRRNITTLVKLINDLLSLSRLESGRTAIRREKLNLNSFIHDVDQNFHGKVEERFAANLPIIEADPDLVTEVLINLLDNATRYAREIIVVTTAIVNGANGFPEFIKVSIYNDGPGISPENVGKLFEKFVQLDREERTSDYKGTGLGLAICKEIVELHLGKIWIESPPEGGVTFSFTLSLHVQ